MGCACRGRVGCTPRSTSPPVRRPGHAQSGAPDVRDQGQIANYLPRHHLVITYDGASLIVDGGGANINTQLALFPA